MKKIYKPLFVLLLLVLIKPTYSQVSLYTFSQSVSSYSAITGGTAFGSTATDDEVFLNPAAPLGAGVGATGPGMPIGFNFLFDGLVFDRIGINANGFIYLGQSTLTPIVDSWISNAFAPISATSTALPNKQYKVCAFGMDIQAQTGLNSEIRMQTIGTAPNRTAVVQWTNYRKYNNSGDDFNFQIRLIESSNLVEVVYGVFVNNATAGAVQVGLRGAAPNDFNNRFVNAINIWSASAAGNSNTIIANFNSGLVPTNGLVYRWIPPPPCTGAPAANTVVSSVGAICPFGTASLSLANPYTNSGITYQWFFSGASSTGPYFPVSGSAGAFYNPNNIVNNTWYRCVITCASSSLSTIATPFQVVTTGAAIDNVPYSEGFESLILNNQFPTCSWAASQPTSVCQTYTIAASGNRTPHTGNKFAAFKAPTFVGGDYIYTGGIQLIAGITYSASMWYTSDGSFGWSNLALSYGAAQSSIGLTPIASASNISIGFAYASLSNTFTVANSGIYVLAVSAISAGGASYLSFDDLSITIPCALNPPNFTLVSTPPLVCEGQSVTIAPVNTGSITFGAGNPTGTLVTYPTPNNIFAVTGTHTVTNCSATKTISIPVNPTPVISLLSPRSTVCLGDSIKLDAMGAPSFSWSTGQTGNSVFVKPTGLTVYSVTGLNSFSCPATVGVTISVIPTPTINVSIQPTICCKNETVSCIASGALTFTWVSNPNIYAGSNFTLAPQQSDTYTVSGKGANGCVASKTLALVVNECTGIEERNQDFRNLTVSPNPFNDWVELSLNDVNESLIVRLFDVHGRVVHEVRGNYRIDLSSLSKGVYLLKAEFENKEYTARVIKQ